MAFWQVYLAKLLSLYYNVKIGAFLVWCMISYGPSTVLRVKERPNKPQILKQDVTDRFVKINEVTIHYVECGDREKPLLLFVHGFPEFWFSWRNQLKEFSNDYWCVALDMRGYNESSKPPGLEPYAMDNLISDLYELIKYLGKPPTLICHDWGSIIGFAYVLKHMDTVKNYVMMCAPPAQVHRAVTKSNPEQRRMSWYILFFQGRLIPELMLRSFDLRTFHTMRSAAITKEDIEAYKYVFGQKDALTPPLNYYRVSYAKYKGEKTTFDHSQHKKGLLLLAENDLYISTANGPAAEKFIPNLKYKVMKNVDHFAQQTSPEVVNKHLWEFLKEQSE